MKEGEQGASPARVAPEEPARAEPAPGQLAFEFAVNRKSRARRGESASAATLRNVPQGGTAERRLRLNVPERPIEEMRFEQTLLAHIPPGKSLQVTLTENRYTMVAVRRSPLGYTLRIHRMFAVADGRLCRAIARYVVHNDSRASEVIGHFIERNQHVIKSQPRRPRRVVLRTVGRVHDLQRLFDRLNRVHFAGRLEARITWGSAPRRRGPRRSIKMGSYAVEDRLIRIHPLLDHTSVPEYFVAWIIYHEMLHGRHEVERRGGRRCFHTEAFLADERAYPDYDRASAWEKANIDRLLDG